MNIGNQIQVLRKQNNITQEKLAAEMGVSIAAVSKWENGNSMPNVLMLCALADYFKVTTDELLGRNKMQDFLICDDAAMIREALHGIIMNEGYRNIRLAENGKQLLDAVGKKIPYAIFLDINLPDINGLEILEKIKEQNKSIKVIMITADWAESTRKLAIELGADAYITKPFLPEHIRAVINDSIFFFSYYIHDNFLRFPGYLPHKRYQSIFYPLLVIKVPFQALLQYLLLVTNTKHNNHRIKQHHQK